MYGITIAGHKVDLIVKPFIYSNVKVVETIVIFTDNDPEAKNVAISASKVLMEYGVNTEIVNMDNIFNFQRIFFIAKKILREKGKPEWINVSAGPGVAIAAMVLAFPRSNLVYFKRGIPTGEVVSIDIERTVMGFKKIEELIPVLEYIKNEKFVEFDELSSQFEYFSRASISRRISLLNSAGLVNSKGAGRGGERKKYYLSSLGEYILTA